MEAFVIRGGKPLRGAVQVGGAKNAALPILAATLLTDEPCTLENVPRLGDVDTLGRLLAALGTAARRDDAGRLHIESQTSASVRAPAKLVRRMRASFCVLAPLLARRGRAIVPLPGGCRLGARPVDVHLRALAAFGAELRVERGYISARASRLRGAVVDLQGERGPTVTGTAQALCAAVLASGESILRGAATEPEIVDLGSFLVALGARIEGLGTATLRVVGVSQLGGANYRLIPDRIAAATLLFAGALPGSDVTVRHCEPRHMQAVLELLGRAGADIHQPDAGTVRVRGPERLRAVDFTAAPYPALPTDVQPQWTVLASLADGRSQVRDRVFPERFGHVAALARMGARIAANEQGAVALGTPKLYGSRLAARDLRQGAALVLAALAAEGTSVVRRVVHIDRGYERFEKQLAALGGRIVRRELQPSSRIVRPAPSYSGGSI